MGWYEPDEEHRCTAMLDAETGRRCPEHVYKGEAGEDLCWGHYKGPEKSAAAKKGGVAHKTMWQRIKAGARILKQAKTRAGSQELVLANIQRLWDLAQHDDDAAKSLDRMLRLNADLAAEIEDKGDHTQTIEVGVTINVEDRGDLAERVANVPVANVPVVDEGDETE